jgi:hypothetical protein
MIMKLHYILFLVVSLFAVSANGAAITGYSVNSDSGSENQDSLYRIDLLTATDDRQGRLVPDTEAQRDTEGLAFDSAGVLWGVDDLTLTLFRINTISGAILSQDERALKDLPSGGGHDFGMTFSCDDSLYITSDINDSLYLLDLQGNSQLVGSFDANISAIAAKGSPTRLYGLGNGLDQDGEVDSPNLYSIDVSSGAATLIGPLGGEAEAYNQAGLAFDSEGNLWAITDRRGINKSSDGLSSQILSIDEETGTATWVGDTNEVGFESLAIAAPTGCVAQADSTVDVDVDVEVIPTLGGTGRLFTIFFLLFSGLIILRRHLS